MNVARKIFDANGAVRRKGQRPLDGLRLARPLSSYRPPDQVRDWSSSR
jgi:hypothetical protein